MFILLSCSSFSGIALCGQTGALVTKNFHHQSASASLHNSPTVSEHSNYYKVELTFPYL